MDDTALSQDEIESILQKLQSPAFYIKLETIQKVGTLKSSDIRIVEALILILKNDTDDVTRQRAKQALLAPVHLAMIKQQNPEYARKMAEQYRDLRAPLAKQRAIERTLGILTRLLAFIAAGVAIWGLISFPFMAFLADGNNWSTTPAMDAATKGGPALAWACLLLALIAPFIGGEKKGWWWILAGLLGIGVLAIVGRQTTNNILEAAKWGFIGRTFLETITGTGDSSQTIENIRFSTGFYVSILGLIFLMASGVWDIVQKETRKSDTKREIYEIDEVLKTLEGTSNLDQR